MKEQMVGFVRGLLLLLPSLIIGILIAKYVPPRVIGFACIGILLLLIHFAGTVLRWPWRRK